jgi:hypothetical protein
MNTSDLRDALRLDAELVGEPPRDLLEQVWDRRRRENRRRAAVAFSVLLVGAGIPLGAAVLRPSAGDVAAPPAGVSTPSIEEQRAALAAEFGITDPPDVTVVQLVTPEQRGAFVEACLTEQGYSPTEGAYAVPIEETAAFDLANYICLARYPIDPSYTGVPDDEDLVVD